MNKDNSMRYTSLFFVTYFLYYSGYCIFSSYMVPYLAENGYSASVSGVVTSLMMIASVLMQPIAGYLTDTVLPARKYLAITILMVVILAMINSLSDYTSWLNIIIIIISATFSYSFSNLMDAWVNRTKELDTKISYSRIRAGGSIGFGITSILFGHILTSFGYRWFFLIQGGIFLLLMPFLYFLPDLELKNRRTDTKEKNISFNRTFSVLLKDKKYCMILIIFTLYWMGHRPIGSYLSLIVRQRGGSDGLYGNICGIGAVVECFLLIFMYRFKSLKRMDRLIFLTLCTSLLRPLLLLLVDGTIILYVGQILQSISFALCYSVIVDAFSKFSDYRIKSFSISVGLTVASVVGMTTANLVGGFAFDLLGANATVWVSFLISANNLLIFMLFFRKIIVEKNI